MAEEAKKSRGAWFREMKSELKKVTWPNQKTVVPAHRRVHLDL